MNMIKKLRCRFQQCFCTSAMVLVQGSSETRLFSDLSNHNFGVCNFGNTKAMSVIFFKKCLKFKIISKMEQKSEKKFFVCEIILSELVSLNVPLLRTGYFSSAANVLTSSTKILHVNKKDFFQLDWFGSDQLLWSSAMPQISTDLWHVFHVACRRVHSNETF